MRRHVLTAFVLAASMPVSGAGFLPLSLPGSQLSALSADGQSAAGGLVGGASGGFRWHEGEGPRTLSGAMSVRAISASGRYVAGSSLDAGQHEVATWWDAEGRAHALGGLPDADAQAGVLSVAYGITDQPHVVGTAVNAQRESVAFAWTSAEGLRLLASSGTASGASGISSDGRRIYGWSERADATRRGVLWNQGRVCCTVETGAMPNELVGANRGATLLLGLTHEAPDADTPFRWSPDVARTETAIATPSNASTLRFTAGSDDGRVLAGASGSGAHRVAMIWTEGGGVERLDAFVASRGLAIPSGWTLIAATAVSADGSRLGGYGLVDGRFDSFVIDLPRGDAAAHSPTAP
ncbi:MAG TPA: hypothetical protein VKB52_11095 [Rhodanobacteraceae bacterium]|nr:hypothetical protein [Rhodanobacteraceae bacterium]